MHASSVIVKFAKRVVWRMKAAVGLLALMIVWLSHAETSEAGREAMHWSEKGSMLEMKKMPSGNAYSDGGPVKAIVKNKLPSWPSLEGGHGFIHACPAKTICLNKLPSGPSPGVGHAYTDAGPVKAAGNAWMKTEKMIALNKLPSGPSNGVGHK